MNIFATQRIAFDKEITWYNPDGSHGVYRYPYYLRTGTPDSWMELRAKLTDLQADRFFVVIDSNFPPQIVQTVCEQIESVAPPCVLAFDGNEREKNLYTLARLEDEAIARGATRSSVILALGGGLAGNIAGLLAGLLYRGTRFVHLPTTLLAASDSCLSLKQGVNSNFGKNHIGMFYAPEFVWADLSMLATLPARETRSALCELIKNVLAIKPDAYDEIARVLHREAKYSYAQLADFIAFCIDAKSSVMASDALEKHDALALEYGHTVAHVIELQDTQRFPHGLAVGLGMMVEGTISNQLGMLSAGELEAHRDLLQRNGTLTRIPTDVSIELLLENMGMDNKRGYRKTRDGYIDMVLLKTLGQPNKTDGSIITQVPKRDVRRALEVCTVA